MPERWLWISFPHDWVSLDEGEDDRSLPKRPDHVHAMCRTVRHLALVKLRRVLQNQADGDELFEFVTVGIASVKKLLDEVPASLAEAVARRRSARWSWSVIGEALEMQRTAAQRKFKNVSTRDASHESVGDPEEDLTNLWLMGQLERIGPCVLRDLVVQARCEGYTWNDIGEALGVGATAAHRRFGKGLPPRRIRELDDELVWAAENCPDPAAQHSLSRRLEQRRLEVDLG